MIMRSLLKATLALLFCSCSSQLASQQEQRFQQSVNDIHIELADIKHELNSHEVDLRIMEEKLQKQIAALQALQTQNKAAPKASDGKDQIAALERRIASMEKMQDKIVSDLKQLSSYANQASSTLSQYKEKIAECEQEIARHTQKLDEVAKLKGTLTSISKAIKPAQVENSGKNYRVKAGDSLEKIAKLHHCSVDRIKQLNQLENDRIVIGQDIKLPNE
jgi:LysM repeat protein